MKIEITEIREKLYKRIMFLRSEVGKIGGSNYSLEELTFLEDIEDDIIKVIEEI